MGYVYKSVYCEVMKVINFCETGVIQYHGGRLSPCRKVFCFYVLFGFINRIYILFHFLSPMMGLHTF